MTVISPREFLEDYVKPSIEHYGKHRLEKHLAVNAISQTDNLAEVLAFHLMPVGQTALKRGEAGELRRNLRAKWSVLGTINDAHDCHKHGKLERQSATNDPKGISAGRPEQKTEHGFFLNHTHLDGPLTPYEVLVVTLNDSSQREICGLLWEALTAWEEELRQRGL